MFHGLSLASAKMCVCEYVGWVKLRKRGKEGGSCLVGWAEVGIFGAKVRCGRSLKSVTGRQQQTTDGRVTISIFIILILNLPILEVSFFPGQVFEIGNKLKNLL